MLLYNGPQEFLFEKESEAFLLFISRQLIFLKLNDMKKNKFKKTLKI